MLLALASAAVMLTIGLLTIDPVFRLLGADDNMLPMIHGYMKIYYWGGIFIVAPMIANSVLRASGDAKRPAMIMTAAAILNIVLDAVLIFGLLRLPAHGDPRRGARRGPFQRDHAPARRVTSSCTANTW